MRSFDDNYLEPFLSNAIPIFWKNVLAPIFFQDNFANLVQDTIPLLTPASDYNSLFAERNSQLIWGRHGNDSLVAFDPVAARPGQWQIDIFLGDFVDENFLESLSLVELVKTPIVFHVIGKTDLFSVIGNNPTMLKANHSTF